jgi:cytochrome P450
VAYSEAWGGFFALMRYEDVARAANDYQTFITSVQNVVPKVAFTGRRPPLHLDPPEHSKYRRVLSPLLTESRVAPLEPVIRDICRALLVPMIERGGGDLCDEFSSRMPVQVFAHWMNLKDEEAAKLGEVGRRYNVAVQTNDVEETTQSSIYLYQMAAALVAERRQSPLNPQSDVTSALLAARYDGEALPVEMIIGTIRQVLVVGIIAPTVVIGSIAVHLSRHPDLQQRLRQQPELTGAALEEFLRLYTPYRGFARTAKHEVTFSERTIPKDVPIALVYASANRDEAVFPDTENFVLDRPNLRDSLAFGRGPHMCVGVPLARLELRVALEELLALSRGFSVAGPIVPTRFPEIGALRVPLKFE